MASPEPFQQLPEDIARREVAVAVAGYEYDSDWDPISDGALHDSITEGIYTGQYPPGHPLSPKKFNMPSTAAAKQPSLPAALREMSRENSLTQSTTTQVSATFNARNTRFSRQTSSRPAASAHTRTTPRKTTPGTAAMNPPTQSTSLLLPSLPNVTDVVSGARRNVPPAFINKDTKSRSSRFTSASRTTKPSPFPHGYVNEVATSAEDKAIYASLHLLKDRVDQLEREKSEAQKRTEEYEFEITELRSQLSIIHHRPDSALGSDADFDGFEKLQREKEALEASVLALQDRLSRSERTASVSEISVRRITKERDDLAQQAQVAYANLEELKAENSELNTNNAYLQYEFDELKTELEAMRKENTKLRTLVTQTTTAYAAAPSRQQRRQEVLDKLGKIVRDQKQKAGNASEPIHMLPDRVARGSASAVGLTGRPKSSASRVNSLSSTKDRSQALQETSTRSRRETVESSHLNSMASNKDRSQLVPEEPIRSRKEASDVPPPRRAHRPQSVDESMTRRLASAIAKEAFQYRDPSAATTASRTRTRSRSDPYQESSVLHHQVSMPTFTVSAPTDSLVSDDESTTQLHHPQKAAHLFKQGPLPSRDLFNQPPMPSTYRSYSATTQEDDTKDTTGGATEATMLSYQDPRELSNLRNTLEDQIRERKMSSAQYQHVEYDAASSRVLDVDLLAGQFRKDAEYLHDELEKPCTFRKTSASMNDATGRSSLYTDKTEDFSGVSSKGSRAPSPHTVAPPVNTAGQSERSKASIVSNSSRRRRRAEATEGMTSAFIVPDITLNTNKASTPNPFLQERIHDRSNCTCCPSTGQAVQIPAPVPVTDRDDVDATDATIRPSQPPSVALATVIKQLEDEIVHLKHNLVSHQRLYNRHDASISKRRRQDLKILMDKFTDKVEKRSDQVYALYDVLEGQKQAAALARKRARRMPTPHMMEQEDVETTLSSLGMDTGEISGLIARASVAPLASEDGTESVDGPSGDDTEEMNTEDMH